MAKAKPQPKSNEKKGEHKVARTNANRMKRAAKHIARLKKQQAKCPKVTRGTARALRRFCDRTSREFPAVLKGRYTMSMLFRVPKREPKPQPKLGLLINGKPMGSMAEVLWTVRNLAEQAKQRQAESMHQ
jgi:predicted ATPase